MLVQGGHYCVHFKLGSFHIETSALQTAFLIGGYFWDNGKFMNYF